MENKFGCSESDLSDLGKMRVTTPELETSSHKHEAYPWSDSEKKIIQSHRDYCYEMMFILDDLAQDGPEGILLPKKPSGRLEPLLGVVHASRILSGLELHKYLSEKIIILVSPPATCPGLQFVNVDSLEGIKSYLKAGYDLISRQTTTTLQSYLEYGRYLNFAYQLHQVTKWTGQKVVSWENWLKDNVGITASFSRKLREMAKLVGEHKKFRTINISFTELYQRRKQIENLLTIHKEVNEFWKH